MKKPKLSVIISAYNEEDNLKRGALDSMLAFLKTMEVSWEVVLVNDGSTDKTSALLHKLEKPNIRVIDNPHQGKALGVITGGLSANGEIVLFTDMDQATPITEINKLLEKLSSGYDIAIGSRSGRKGAPMFRQILAYGMVILRTLILNLPYRDTQCGFKMLKSEAAKKIFTKMKSLRTTRTIEGPAVDPGFDVELLYLARKLGYKISEVPVIWNYQESRRVRFFYDMISGVHGLLLVRFRSITNAYKL